MITAKLKAALSRAVTLHPNTKGKVMTVLNVATTHLKDADKMQAYIDAAAPLMKQHGAEVVVRGHYLKSLLGEGKSNHILGIFRFPDMETAEAFYECDEYKELVNLRDQAGKMAFNFYEE